MANVSKIHIVKLLELILVLVLLILHFTSNLPSSYELHFEAGATIGYTIIIIGVLAACIMAVPLNRRIDLFYSLVGLVIFIALGILVFTNAYEKHLARGIISIIVGILLFVDAVFTFKQGE